MRQFFSAAFSACVFALAISTHGLPAQTPSPAADLKDSTANLQALINDSGGKVTLSSGRYRITKTLEFDLVKHGAAALQTDGAVTLIMDGPGPALRFTGSHEGTAAPDSFQPETWRERMPRVSGIEILGKHPEADGIELVQTVQPTITDTAIRGCRHGIHLVNRNRNVIISDCHLYENSGVGIYLDDVNLHQINVTGSHISYNRQGGIVVRDGNVRNLQIANCDIEGNMPGDETPTTAANVLIDVSQSDKSRSVAEVAITGCTIQHSANYGGSTEKTIAPGGANIRILGKESYPVNMVTISGNVISDTETNTEIKWAHDVTLTGNVYFAPKNDNLIVEDCQRIVVSGNAFNPRQFERPGQIVFRRSSDCIVANNALHKLLTTDGALLLEQCQGFTLNGLSLTDCASGIVLRGVKDTTLTACQVSRTADGADDLSADDGCAGLVLTGNRFSGKTAVPESATSQP